MKIKLKNKISLGIIFLLLMIMLLGGLGAYYLRILAIQSEQIMKDNYHSVVYAQSMIQATNAINNLQATYFFYSDSANRFDSHSYENAKKLFQDNLNLQEKNITERGEKNLVQTLKLNYQQYLGRFQTAYSKSQKDSDIYFTELVPLYNLVRLNIEQVYDVNQEAILQKSDLTQNTAHQTSFFMMVVSLICLVLTIVFLFIFPNYLANPVLQLIESIRHIADHRYDQKLHFESNDEFADLANAFNAMAEKINEYENSNLSKLILERRRFNTLINNLKDAIIGLDERKNIIFANQTAFNLLGLTEKDMIGKYAPDVAMSNDLMRNLIKDMMTEEAKKENDQKKPLKIFDQNKESYFSKEVLEVTIPSDKGSQLMGYVIELKNITKFWELDLAKTNFIATVSHELKTPISSIRMSLKLLEDSRVGNINEEQQDLIKNIKEESDRLLNITSELLDLTQAESGDIHLTLRQVKPREIVDYAFVAVKFQADQKNVKIEIESQNYLPLVKADLEKSAWVLINLLSNAIKHSPKNAQINIKTEQKADQVVFFVKDFGKGIDKAYHDKIFEKFFKIPDANQTGTGLGLAISKEIVLKQNGQIGVESELGEGSLFYFSLPVAFA